MVSSRSEKGSEEFTPMSTMAKTRFRAQMETLERRETPTAAAGLHALASMTVAVKGSGNGQVTSEMSAMNTVVLTANVSGKDQHLGSFTGVVKGQLSPLTPTSSSASGTATLTATPGNAVDLTLTGKVHTKKGSSSDTGTFKFTVASGTGEFAGATGSGSGSGTINTSTGSLTFKYQGRVQP
jgi:hypothetical protein